VVVEDKNEPSHVEESICKLSVVAHEQCLTLSNVGVQVKLHKEINVNIITRLRTELKYPRDIDRTC
jgi:hypothetical protein